MRAFITFLSILVCLAAIAWAGAAAAQPGFGRGQSEFARGHVDFGQGRAERARAHEMNNITAKERPVWIGPRLRVIEAVEIEKWPLPEDPPEDEDPEDPVEDPVEEPEQNGTVPDWRDGTSWDDLYDSGSWSPPVASGQIPEPATILLAGLGLGALLLRRRR